MVRWVPFVILGVFLGFIGSLTIFFFTKEQSVPVKQQYTNVTNIDHKFLKKKKNQTIQVSSVVNKGLIIDYSYPTKNDNPPVNVPPKIKNKTIGDILKMFSL